MQQSPAYEGDICALTIIDDGGGDVLIVSGALRPHVLNTSEPRPFWLTLPADLSKSLRWLAHDPTADPISLTSAEQRNSSGEPLNMLIVRDESLLYVWIQIPSRGADTLPLPVSVPAIRVVDLLDRINAFRAGGA